MVQQRISRTRSAPLENLLLSRAPLSEQHLAFLRRELGQMRTLGAGAAVFHEVSGPVVIASGWAASVWEVGADRRQVTDFFLPGDIVTATPHPHDGPRPVAVTPLSAVDASRLAASLSSCRDPELLPLAEAWLEERQAVQARSSRHLVRLGRLSSYERTADLLLDLYARLLRAGLADRGTMSMPLTQELLAEHLGISKVHMNRTLQQLRRDGLVTSVRGELFAVDPGGLRRATPLRESEAEKGLGVDVTEDGDVSLLLSPVDARGSQ